MISSALRSVLGKDQESLKAEVRTHQSLLLAHTFEDCEAVLPSPSASLRTEPNTHPKVTNVPVLWTVQPCGSVYFFK